LTLGEIRCPNFGRQDSEGTVLTVKSEKKITKQEHFF